MLDGTKKYLNKLATDTAVSVVKFIQIKYPDFTLSTIKLDWSERRKCHRGGMYAAGPGINLAMIFFARDFESKQAVFTFKEYSSYEKDPVIGSFTSNTPELKLEATVVHECSHALQHWLAKKQGVKFAPHGVEFKSIYSKLRKEFINPFIPKQSWTKQKGKRVKASLLEPVYIIRPNLKENCYEISKFTDRKSPDSVYKLRPGMGCSCPAKYPCKHQSIFDAWVKDGKMLGEAYNTSGEPTGNIYL